MPFKTLQASRDGTYWTIVTALGDRVMKVLGNRNTVHRGDRICCVCAPGVVGWARASKRRPLKDEPEMVFPWPARNLRGRSSERSDSVRLGGCRMRGSGQAWQGLFCNVGGP